MLNCRLTYSLCTVHFSYSTFSCPSVHKQVLKYSLTCRFVGVFQVDGMMKYSFCAWLPLRGVMLLEFLHPVSCVSAVSVFWLCEDVSHFVYSVLDGQLGCIYFLDIMNNASINIVYVKNLLCELNVFISFTCVPRRRISEVNYLRNCQTFFVSSFVLKKCLKSY